MSSAPYVWIPGAGGEAWSWHRVVSRLRRRGHDAVALDLPAADDRAGLREYADTVVEAAAGREEVIVVAQSMGAFVAPLVCDRLDVALLGLVAPMIPAPGESAGEWWSTSGHGEVWGDRPFDVMTCFFHDVPAEVVEEALARGEPRQSDTPMKEPWPLEAWPDVPTRVVVGRQDRLFPFEFLRALSRERLGIEPDVIDSGHLPALSRPDELVAVLEGWRARPTSRPAARESSSRS